MGDETAAMKRFLLSLFVVLLPACVRAQEREPFLAVSTNGAFDAVTAVNLAAEVRLSPQFTLKAEGIFPWWTWNNGEQAFQVNHLNLGFRYWFGGQPFKGWYGNTSLGIGRYDVQPRSIGWRGRESMVTMGGGYAVPLGGRVVLDFGLGLGSMLTRYDRYEWADGMRKVTDVGRYYLYLGPTDVHISVVYLFSRPRREPRS